MKQTRIKRLFPKKVAEGMALIGRSPEEIRALAERDGGKTIAKMRAKGYTLVTCLETGEGVFVRDDHLSALHIQLPADLYERLCEECERRETTKRALVAEALEAYIDRGGETG